MADIRYKWNDGLNSVQVSGDVSLPQFKVLGHRQKTIEASLSTGQYTYSIDLYRNWQKKNEFQSKKMFLQKQLATANPLISINCNCQVYFCF